MRLGVWQKSAVYTTVITVGASGLIWFVVHDFISDEQSDVTRALLTLHGVASYALLVDSSSPSFSENRTHFSGSCSGRCANSREAVLTSPADAVCRNCPRGPSAHSRAYMFSTRP